MIKGRVDNKKVSTGMSPKGKWVRVELVIDGIKYASFNNKFSEALKIGDVVNFEFEQKGAFRNITKIAKADEVSDGQIVGVNSGMKSGTGRPSPDNLPLFNHSGPLPKEELMVRMNAVNNAVALVKMSREKGVDIDLKAVKEVADKIVEMIYNRS